MYVCDAYRESEYTYFGLVHVTTPSNAHLLRNFEAFRDKRDCEMQQNLQNTQH